MVGHAGLGVEEGRGAVEASREVRLAVWFGLGFVEEVVVNRSIYSFTHSAPVVASVVLTSAHPHSHKE